MCCISCEYWNLVAVDIPICHSTNIPTKYKTSNFSAAKAALEMQMSVNLSVIHSVTLIFLSDLLVYFTIANRIKLK